MYSFITSFSKHLSKTKKQQHKQTNNNNKETKEREEQAAAADEREEENTMTTTTINQAGEAGGNQDQIQAEEDQSGCCSAAPSCLRPDATASDVDHRQPSSLPTRRRASTISTTTTTRTHRSNFAKSTTSTLFPNTQFTNHESLPFLSDALSTFTQAYPQYSSTHEADRIRERHYSHLSDHLCFDYTGFSLFSHSQLLLTLLQQPQPSCPFFDISHKPVSLASQVQYDVLGSQGSTGLESAIRSRIMSLLNVLPEDYAMVCTANRTSAFKLLAEAYPFRSSTRLVTVCDHDCEAVSSMQDCALSRGAKVLPASFSWPSLRIQSAKLKRILQVTMDNSNSSNNGSSSNKKKKKKKKKRGLFIFPLQSRMTGARYPYLWMRIAQDNGWHVALDASALGPKDLDTLGLSLIQPDFIICSFFKVVGEDPSGFATLLIKKSSSPLLEASVVGTSVGLASIVPARIRPSLSRLTTGDIDHSATFSETDGGAASFSGSLSTSSTPVCRGGGTGYIDIDQQQQPRSSKQPVPMGCFEQGETSSSVAKDVELEGKRTKLLSTTEIEELEANTVGSLAAQAESLRSGSSHRQVGVEIECLALDHADSLGLLLIGNRLRCITNWLVMALVKLRHPNSNSENATDHPLVRIYGPRVKFERGPAISFNLFDWKGEKIDPSLIQKLADRCNISLSCGFLHNICFSDKYEAKRDAVLERRRNICGSTSTSRNRRKDEVDQVGIEVVNASFCFLANFEDAYKLWSFVARFLDADFVEKERWRYMALNQKMIEV